MNLNQVFDGDGQSASSPVFDGLEKLGVNGRDIAEIAKVSAPTVSKWRKGHVPVPGEVIALLTLILASYVEDVLEQKDGASEQAPVWSFHQRAGLEAAREDLSAQEIINHSLPPAAVRSGAIRFRYWWNTQLRRKMSDMAMSTGHIDQIVVAL